MYITIKIKDSKQTHRINVIDDFIKDKNNSILSWDKQALKAKEVAWDMYGKSVESVELIKS
jgi:hypothetical protein